MTWRRPAAAGWVLAVAGWVLAAVACGQPPLLSTGQAVPSEGSAAPSVGAVESAGSVAPSGGPVAPYAGTGVPSAGSVVPSAGSAVPWAGSVGHTAAMTAVVVRVVDGDTLILRIARRPVRVRLIGVDAPETWLRHDCFGAAATRGLRRLTPPGTALRAAGDVQETDRYGRRLLYLWTIRGAFVNAELVRAGFARAFPVPPDTSRAATLADAEQTARHERVGLWRPDLATCGLARRASTRPYDANPASPP